MTRRAVRDKTYDVKGDLFVATSDDTATRLPVGPNGSSIFADGTQATGFAWGKTVVRGVDNFQNVRAEDVDWIVAAEPLNVATPITCTIANQPDQPRNVTIKVTDADGGISAFSITVTGVSAKGTAATTETFTLADGLVQVGNVAFATIVSIVVTSITGAGAGDVLDVGIGSKLGLANPISAAGDVYKVTKNTEDLGVLDYTIDATYGTADVSTAGAITDADDYTVWYKAQLTNA